MSSGKLWCGTCHDPHAQRGRADSAAYYRSRCLACHGDALPKTHPRPNDNCAGCHMPTLPVTNGGHTIFTDHRIAIYTAQEIAGKAAPASAQPAVEAGDLEAWHAPARAFEERNLGLADVFAGERLHRLALVNQGLELLLRSQQQYPNDVEIESAIGAVRLGEGDAADAATRFEKVIQMTPNDAPSYVLAALAWHALHNQAKAIERLNQALELDPLVHQPYRNLAQIYSEQNNAAMVRQTYQRFLKAFPESVEAQSDVARTVRLMARPVAGGGGAGAH
jgi:tetratricopeptide (TPR) repeat protein